MRWKRIRISHQAKQDPVNRASKQADMDMLELAAAHGVIDLKYLDESGFSAWSDSGYTYYQKGEQKKLEQTKRRGRRISIIGLFQPLISFIYGLVIGGVEGATKKLERLLYKNHSPQTLLIKWHFIGN